MNWEVQLYVSGKVFYEYVIARDYQDAKQTALSRNPTARVISITAKLGRQGDKNILSVCH